MSSARSTFDELLAAFEAPVPSPAGGSAAAAVAAIGASLVAMAGHGSPDWADGPQVAREATELRRRLLALVDEDVEAVAGVLAASRAAREGSARDGELDAARATAVRVPLEIAEHGAAVAALATRAARSGKPSVRPDAAAAAALATAAAQVAAAIVDHNLAAHPTANEPPDLASLRARLRLVSARLAEASPG